MTRGGAPRGRHSVFFAPPSTGKTATITELIKGAQSMGIVPLLLSPEPPDIDWMEVQGVNRDYLDYSEDQECGRILNCIDETARGSSKPNEIDPGNPVTHLIIVDSVAAMKNTEEALKGAAGDDMAITARRLSRFFRSQNSGVTANKVAVVWINQIRVDDMSSMSQYKLDNYPGGNALKFYSGLDIHLRRGGKSTMRNDGAYEAVFGKKAEDIKGFPNVYKVRKTKLYGVPERSEAMGIFFDGIGFQREQNLAEFMLVNGMATQSGAKYVIELLDPSNNTVARPDMTGYENYLTYINENYDAVFASAFDLYGRYYEADKGRSTALPDSVEVKEDNDEQPPDPEAVPQEAREIAEKSKSKRKSTKDTKSSSK
jgi:RecA/RadA recombinase